MQIRIRQRMRQGRRFEGIDEETAAMIAGYIDSDGSIFKLGKYAVQIMLGQTDFQFVKTLSEFGGTVYEQTFENSNRNKMYYWILRIQNVQRTFLEKTLPYYVLKRRQAELALEIIKELQSKKEGWKQRCRQLQEQITKLNHEKPDKQDVKTWEGRI